MARESIETFIPLFKGSIVTIDDCGRALLNPAVAIVSDFDHTIIDTTQYHRTSFTRAVESQIGQPIELTEDFIVSRLRGREGTEVCQVLHDTYGQGSTPELVTNALTARRMILADLVLEQPNLGSLIPGVASFVRQLRSYQRVAGISTQSPDIFPQQLLQCTLIDDQPMSDVFPSHAIVGETTLAEKAQAIARYEGYTPSLAKPNSYSVELAASLISGQSHEGIIYFGDSDIDGKTVAGREGFVGVLVNQKRAADLSLQFSEYPNIIVVESLEELTK